MLFKDFLDRFDLISLKKTKKETVLMHSYSFINKKSARIDFQCSDFILALHNLILVLVKKFRTDKVK